jgi:hypothetical protein
VGTYYITRNDTKPLHLTLRQGNRRPITLGGATVRILLKERASGAVISGNCAISDANRGKIQYNWSSGQTSTAGTYDVEFEVTAADGKVETVPGREADALVIRPDLG